MASVPKIFNYNEESFLNAVQKVVSEAVVL